MEKEIKKEIKQIDNSSYIERYQFVLQINDDIICQRYFKINGLTNEALESEEFKNVMDEVVRMIQDSLVSKSRVYDWYTREEPIKLTGFASNYDEYTSDDVYAITRVEKHDKVITLSNGETIEKTYFTYPSDMIDTYVDNERPVDGEFMFKFSFLVDNKPKYERIWDGNVYHKYVRNSVDLSNSDASYRDKDPLSLHFNVAIIRHMTSDKVDLVYHIIKKICSVLSSTPNGEESVREYTKKTKYGDNVYYYSTKNKTFINGWREATMKKTNKYLSELFPNEKQIKYYDNYL